MSKRYNKYKYTTEDKSWKREGGKTGSKFIEQSRICVKDIQIMYILRGKMKNILAVKMDGVVVL